MPLEPTETRPRSNRPFAVYDHMVQKPPCWKANYPLGHPKQKNIKLSCFVLDVPVGSLLSSMVVFVPCDRQLQRAYFPESTNAFAFSKVRSAKLNTDVTILMPSTDYFGETAVKQDITYHR